MVVTLQVFTTVKRTTEQLLMRATMQNEEKTLLDGCVQLGNIEHLLYPDMPKLKKHPLVETSQQN